MLCEGVDIEFERGMGREIANVCPLPFFNYYSMYCNLVGTKMCYALAFKSNTDTRSYTCTGQFQVWISSVYGILDLKKDYYSTSNQVQG